MALETGVTYIEDLVETNPNEADSDTLDEADNHMRLIKTAVKGSFPSLGAAAVTKTAAEINDTIEFADILDEDNMSSDSATDVASQQSIKAYIDTLITSKTADLNTKIVNIGSWNMDTVATVNIAHGVTLSKIRTVQIIIIADTGSYYMFGGTNEPAATTRGLVTCDGTNVNITRPAGGIFDSGNFNSTTSPANRGYITIQYTD